VANAHALVWGTQLDATTNELGAFALDGLPGGTHTLEVRAISHVPVTSTVHLAESRPATVNVALARPVQVLADVTVRGALVYSRNLAEFERRRQSGFGSYQNSREIEQRGPNVRLTQLLREFPNVRVTIGRGGSSVTMQRNATTGGGRESCSPSLYVDGTLDYARDYDFYYAELIAGIEVYREASRPFEFLDHSNACGAIVIWTRPAPAKRGKEN